MCASEYAQAAWTRGSTIAAFARGSTGSCAEATGLPHHIAIGAAPEVAAYLMGVVVATIPGIPDSTSRASQPSNPCVRAAYEKARKWPREPR